MKIIGDSDNFFIYLYDVKLSDIDDLKKYFREKILLLKKKFFNNISGIYDVSVYSNDRIGLIVCFNREEEFDFLRDVVDLNLKVYEKTSIFLEFDDIFVCDSFDNVYFFNNKFYINVDSLDYREFLKIIEFSCFVFGDKLEKIKTKLNLVVKNS